MTIRKGQDWGSMRVPENVVVVSSDAELAGLVATERRPGTPPPVFGLAGGDLMRTVGGSGRIARFSGNEEIPHLPIDLVRVVVDGTRSGHFVAHLVARNSWWRGAVTAAMNAQFLQRWDAAPRGHPNDGRVDVVTVSAGMAAQQRFLAARRARVGTHVPHPLISVVSRSTVAIELASPTRLWLDGQRWGSGRHLELEVVPDAFAVCV